MFPRYLKCKLFISKELKSQNSVSVSSLQLTKNWIKLLRLMKSKNAQKIMMISAASITSWERQGKSGSGNSKTATKTIDAVWSN